MYNIDIHGSCVTRDAFEYDTCNLFKVNEYVSRCSIFSAVSKPVYDIKVDSDKTYGFKLQCVQTDFSKNLFERFAQSNAKILVIDLIDERHNLLMHNGCFVTDSVCLQESEIIEKESFVFEKINSIDFTDSTIDNAINIYAERIMKVYEPQKILINRALFAREYRGLNKAIYAFPDERQKYIAKMNHKLEKLYAKLESQFPGCSSFDMPEKTLADEENKWGLTPYHYTKEFYLEFINYLSVFCNEYS